MDVAVDFSAWCLFIAIPNSNRLLCFLSAKLPRLIMVIPEEASQNYSKTRSQAADHCQAQGTVTLPGGVTAERDDRERASSLPYPCVPELYRTGTKRRRNNVVGSTALNQPDENNTSIIKHKYCLITQLLKLLRKEQITKTATWVFSCNVSGSSRSSCLALPKPIIHHQTLAQG